MKAFTISVLAVFVFAVAACGNIIDYNYTDQKNAERSEFSILIFDASIKVLEREYQDGNGAEVKDQEKITSDIMDSEREVFFGDSVVAIQYLVEFSEAKLVKGDPGLLKDLKWSFRNSAVLVCTHYPRDLIQGNRYRFYIRFVKNQRASKLQLLKSPIQKSENDADLPNGAQQVAEEKQ